MKKFEVFIHPEAENDLKKAYLYYREIDSKLAKRFLKITNITVRDLKKMPFFQVKYDNMRLRIIRKFPYAIHFTVDETKNIVSIYGIRFAPSNPSNWPKEK